MNNLIRSFGLAGLLTYAGATASVEASGNFGGLPDGPDREEVFYTCTACHSIAIVVQQRLNRRVWDEVLDWMVEEQAMEPLEAGARGRILDYLATWLSPDP